MVQRKPKVSIILTSFNHEKYLREAIDSTLNQTFSDFELIIWDDASRDTSWKIIQSYDDPRIKAFQNDRQRRGVYGINKAISEVANGEYIAIHHSDDVWESNKLERQVEVLDNEPGLGAVFTWLKIIDENNSEIFDLWSRQHNRTRWEWLHQLFAGRNYFAHPSVLIRKKCFKEVGLYRFGLAQSGDAEMWSRLLIKFPIKVITEPLTIHRIFSDRSNASGQRLDVEARIKFEWNVLRANLLCINRFDDLVRVFPDLEPYRRHNGFNTKFLLAMVCLSNKSDESAWVLGVSWLYELLGNPGDAREIEELYSFTYVNIVELTARFIPYAPLVRRERDKALAERDRALAELYNVYRSKSWLLTKPWRVALTKTKSLWQFLGHLYQVRPSLITCRRARSALRLLFQGRLAELRLAFAATVRGNAKSLKKDKSAECFVCPQLDDLQPLVSVVIPCFNYGKFVLDAIDSILAQTLKNLEIIVIDGGSTDGETIRTLQAIQRPRTRIMFREGRRFVGDNRNYGIGLASGRYVCCLDADDTLDPTYLEKAVFYLETYGYDVVSTGINFVGCRAGCIDTMEYPDLRDMAEANHVLTCAVFRKKLWESVGGYIDVGIGKKHVAEDWDFWLKLSAHGARIRNIGREHLFNYRVHEGGSLSSSSDVMPLSAQRKFIINANQSLLTADAFRRSEDQQARYLRCEPSQTALASSFESNPHGLTLLLAMPFFLVGGAERLLSGLCQYLVSKGWRLVVISTLNQETVHGSSMDWFKTSTPEVYALTRFLDQIEMADFIDYLLESRKVDCLLNAGSSFVYERMPSIRANNKKTTVIDILFNTVGHVESHLKFKNFISFALAENDEVLDWYKKVAGWSDKRVAKISSGIDLKRLRPLPRPNDLVDKYHIETTELVIGFSGRLSEEKAPDVFLDVAALCSNCKNLRFVMTGGGPLVESIAKMVKMLPTSTRVELAGLVDDVDEYLALYDVLVLPSRIDGRPLVVMEALACGVPVIASNVGGLPDLIKDGVNGYLVPVADAKAIASHLIDLSENRGLLQRLKASARASAEANLDASLAYCETEAVITKMIMEREQPDFSEMAQ